MQKFGNNARRRLKKKQLACCKDNLKAWDCGCPFWCDCCSFSHECTVCWTKYTPAEVNCLKTEE